MKSETCFSKKSGQALTEYHCEEEAICAAEYSKDYYGNDLVPYQCHKCSFWHLSPRARQTPSHKCMHCTGGDGISKDTYMTKKDAIKRSDILYDEQGINLKMYRCKYSDGWHLTKNH
jgi:hypothetical protein